MACTIPFPARPAPAAPQRPRNEYAWLAEAARIRFKTDPRFKQYREEAPDTTPAATPSMEALTAFLAEYRLARSAPAAQQDQAEEKADVSTVRILWARVEQLTERIKELEAASAKFSPAPNPRAGRRRANSESSLRQGA